MTDKRVPDKGRLGATPRNSWGVSAGHADLVRAVVPPRPVSLEADPQSLTIDLNRTAMIVVDMQNDFCSKGGWFDSRGIDISPVRAPIEPLNAFLPGLRKVRVPVVWLNWGNRADLMNLNPTVLHSGNPTGEGVGYGDMPDGGRAPVLRKGGWGARICDDLETARRGFGEGLSDAGKGTQEAHRRRHRRQGSPELPSSQPESVESGVGSIG